MKLRNVLPLLLLASAGVLLADKQRELKPGMNFFKPEQDIAMGREYAQQIERQTTVVNDSRLNNYINKIGKRLTDGIENNPFPFTFKVVQDNSINAFALPGGPMYVHTGLIAAADNEAQIAGVLAHEIGHVMLRHGTNQASKQNLIQIPAMIAAGIFDRGGVSGQLAQMGIGLGANSALLKFSRTAESDADLYGSRLMNKAGYNPVELARFFEKLEAESGKGSAVSQFFSDHPNPGNRVANIQKDMQFYAARDYTDGSSQELAAAKQAVKALPAPRKGGLGQVRQGSGGGNQDSGNRGNPNGQVVSTTPPSGFRQHQTPFYAIAYPDDWQEDPGQDQISATLVTSDGVVRGSNGNNEVSHGVIISAAETKSNDLGGATRDLIANLQQGNQDLRTTGQGQSMQVDSYTALLTPMESPRSAMRPNEKERSLLLTVQHPQGLFYAVFVAPESRWRVAEPEFRQMIQSLRFSRPQGRQFRR